MTTKDLNFIPASQCNSKENYRYEVTLSRNFTLSFSQDVVNTYNLRGIFKFYLDVSNNTIGWTVERSGKLDILKRTKNQGIKKLSSANSINIKAELKKMNFDLTKITTKKHSVNSYKPKGLLEENNKIDYIELDEYAK